MRAKKIDDMYIDALEAEIRLHNQRYWVEAAPTIPDAEYDALVERLRRLRPDSKVLGELGDRAGEAKIAHDPPMLSLAKTIKLEDIGSWCRKIGVTQVYASHKIDGLAVSLEYVHGQLQRASTRGDGHLGEDVTLAARWIPTIPGVITSVSRGRTEIRGEVYLPRTVFAEKYADTYANARNLAAGAMKRATSLVAAGEVPWNDLVFAAYDRISEVPLMYPEELGWLRSDGFTPVWGRVVDVDDDSLRDLLEEADAALRDAPYEADGVVFRAVDPEFAKSLGATSHHPRWALAYKFTYANAKTSLQAVEWSVSSGGTCTPVAVFAPVVVAGATLRRASLCNARYLKDLGLVGAVPGDALVIEVGRRGGVIPKVERVLGIGLTDDKLGIQIPTRCPACGEPLRMDGVKLVCAHGRYCAGAAVARLAHWTDTTGMRGWGGVMLGKLVDLGLVKTYADLYALTPADLQTIGIGREYAEKLLGIRDRTRRMSLATMLVAAGIERLGRVGADKLAAIAGSVETVLDADSMDLQRIQGVLGTVVGQSVVAELRERADELRAVVEVVRIEVADDRVGVPKVSRGKLCFTGTLAIPRKRATELAVAAGWEVVTAVTRDLALLVCGANDGESTKGARARELGIAIATETEFYELARGDR